MAKGLQIEICFWDPTNHTQLMEALTGLYVEDINASVRSVKVFLSDVSGKNLSGSLEVRTHGVLLYDSLISYVDPESVKILAWDLSFGRDLSHKRVFVLDALKPLGIDLSTRYEQLWRQSEQKVIFRNGKVELNSWSA